MARTVKCPSCGAELSVHDGNRDFMFCEYCGTKVRLDDFRATFRYVNETKIHESDNQKELEFRRMDFEEKKRHEDQKYTIMFCVGFTTLGLFFMLIGIAQEFLS